MECIKHSHLIIGLNGHNLMSSCAHREQKPTVLIPWFVSYKLKGYIVLVYPISLVNFYLY